MYKQGKTALGTQYETVAQVMKNFTVHIKNKHCKKLLSLFCSPSQLSRLPEVSSPEACYDKSVEVRFYILM